MEIHSVRFEIYHNNKLVQTQNMDAPEHFIIIQFINYAKQIRNSPEKFKVKLIKPEFVWIPWDNQRKILENCIEIQNYTE